MIHYVTGNILESGAQSLINTVNTVGVMGKGIALQFKKTFPNNFKVYANAYKNNELAIGKLLVVSDSNSAYGEKIIINFPTKKDWRKPSEYSFIELGLDALIEVIEKYNLKSIAIPPLGSGNGGLEWEKVKKIIERKLGQCDVDILVYEPAAHIKEYLKEERAKLTDARALLLFVLYDLVKNGEYVSEFSAEKVCYFLQKFGAKKYLKLTFEPNFYGPYSGKARFLLNALNGSYIMGYSDMNKKPFEPLMLVADGYEDVVKYINQSEELKLIASKTTKFLNGYYSEFALELLSTVDYITTKQKVYDEALVSSELDKWSTRKRSMFSNPNYIGISVNHLKNSALD